MEKVVYNETIEELELPELTPWESIVGRPTSLKDISSGDYNKLQEIDDLGELAWEDVATEIFIATNAITETKIAKDAITTPKIKAGAITSEKLTTGELITLSAQIKDAIISNAKISNLSADKITAGTLTGRTVQTAATNNSRVSMVGSTDTLEWITSSNQISTQMSQYAWSQGSGFKIDHWGDVSIEIGAGTTEFFINFNILTGTPLSITQDGVIAGGDLYVEDTAYIDIASIGIASIGTLGMAGQFILKSLTSDPSGWSDGAMYYNSSTKRTRVKQDGTWRDVWTD